MVCFRLACVGVVLIWALLMLSDLTSPDVRCIILTMPNFSLLEDRENFFPEPPIVFDSHDECVPDDLISNTAFVEEPEFLHSDRMSALEYMRMHS
jgi:hypothetical protein